MSFSIDSAFVRAFSANIRALVHAPVPEYWFMTEERYWAQVEDELTIRFHELHFWAEVYGGLKKRSRRLHR